LNPTHRGGLKYSNIRIRSSLEPAVLKSGVDWYLNDNRHGLWPAQIQAERVDAILWLLYSSELTDITVLKPAIENEIERRIGKRIEVGLRWRNIQLEFSKGPVPPEDIVRAIHIQVEHSVRNEAKSVLQEMYKSKATEWPLHLRLRAVPMYDEATNKEAKDNIRPLRSRQQAFNDEVYGKRKISSWEIKELDFPSSNSKMTLRDMIMKIAPREEPHSRLFNSVDNLRVNRSTVVFTCTPARESEARTVVAGLVTYLTHVYGNEAAEFFTRDAQIRAAESYWDEKNLCVRNKDDDYVSKLLDDDVDADYNFAPPADTSTRTPTSARPAAPDRPIPISLQRNTFGEDDDSIGTFRREQGHSSMTVMSGDSESTIRSLTERLASLETLLRYHQIDIPPEFPTSRAPRSEVSNTAGDSFGNGDTGEGH
jgi:hypothetical protein